MRFSFNIAVRGLQVSKEFTQVEMPLGMPFRLLMATDIDWGGEQDVQVILPPPGYNLERKKSNANFDTHLYVLQDENGKVESFWQIEQKDEVITITQVYRHLLDAVHPELRDAVS